MNEKENDPGQLSAKGQKKTWITSSEKRLNKAKRTELEISTMEEDIWVMKWISIFCVGFILYVFIVLKLYALGL